MATTYQEKKVVKDRIQDLVIDRQSSTKSLINAYKLKSELKTMNSTDVRDITGPSSPKKTALEIINNNSNDPYYKIRTLDPLIVLPERRFEHTQGAVITANETRSRLTKVKIFL
jgi:hypothetical protein